eukprot:4710634-Amphidinium_carterae.1
MFVPGCCKGNGEQRNARLLHGADVSLPHQHWHQANSLPLPSTLAYRNGTLARIIVVHVLDLSGCFNIHGCGLRCGPSQRCDIQSHLKCVTAEAHYATDCWDAEIETCYGWLECVGALAARISHRKSMCGTRFFS